MRENRLREGGGRSVYDGPKVRGGVGRSDEVERWPGGVEKAFTAGKESAGQGHACGGSRHHATTTYGTNRSASVFTIVE